MASPPPGPSTSSNASTKQQSRPFEGELQERRLKLQRLEAEEKRLEERIRKKSEDKEEEIRKNEEEIRKNEEEIRQRKNNIKRLSNEIRENTKSDRAKLAKNKRQKEDLETETEVYEAVVEQRATVVELQKTMKDKNNEIRSHNSVCEKLPHPNRPELREFSEAELSGSNKSGHGSTASTTVRDRGRLSVSIVKTEDIKQEIKDGYIVNENIKAWLFDVHTIILYSYLLTRLIKRLRDFDSSPRIFVKKVLEVTQATWVETRNLSIWF